MKNKLNTMTWLHRWIAGALIIVLMTLMIPTMPAEASARSTAISKYRILLNKSRISVLPQGKMVRTCYDETARYWSSKASNVKFSLAYVDGDDVPELILNDYYYGYGVWSYKNGSFRCLHWSDAYDQIIGYYYKKGVLRENTNHGTSYFNRKYYKLQTGKTKNCFQYEHCFGNGIGSSTKILGRYIKSGNTEKSVSSSAFYKNLKKYTGSVSMSKIYLHNNTAAKKKQFLK